MGKAGSNSAANQTGGWLRFSTYTIDGRWFSVFATFLIMAGAGPTYLFGTYSKQIKATLGYDQTTLNLIRFFKDLGANIGVFSGLIAELTPTWFALLVGSALNFAGYSMIYLTVTEKISKPKVRQMCIYICVRAKLLNFANTRALVTCMKNFHEDRGVMLGLLKRFTGLSGAIMLQLYLAIHGKESKSLILLITWLPLALFVVFVYTIQAINVQRERNELRVFCHFLYVSMALAVFLLIVTLLETTIHFPYQAYAGFVKVVFSFPPLNHHQ